MGIKNHNKIFSNSGKSICLDDIKDSKVAIDMMTYIIRYLIKVDGKKFYFEIERFIRNFTDLNITCFCVFDGKLKPREKWANPKPRSFRFPNMSKINCVKVILNGFDNCYVVDALGEGEAKCCELYKEGRVDFVLSEDSDILMYGIDKFITRYNSISKSGTIYFLQNILNIHGLTYTELFHLCVCLGTDYNCNLKKYSFEELKRLLKVEFKTIETELNSMCPDLARLKDIFNFYPGDDFELAISPK